MDGTYISQSMIILIIFILLQFSNMISVGIKNVQNNWALYKCNPLIIPMAGIFGHDPKETFNSCNQTSNLNLSQYLMAPLQNILGNLSSSGADIGTTIGNLINLGSSSNNGIVSFITNAYGISINLLAEFQRIIQGIRDTMNKVTGIIVTFLYIIEGVGILIPSALKSPPGQAIVWMLNSVGETACNLFLKGGCS